MLTISLWCPSSRKNYAHTSAVAYVSVVVTLVRESERARQRIIAYESYAFSANVKRAGSLNDML